MQFEPTSWLYEKTKLNGSPSWIRTSNPLVNSEVLYH